MKDYERDELRAVADCTGLSTWHFISYAILGAIFQAERELGLRASEMAKLSKRARAELACKYRAVNDTIHSGRTKRDADN